MSGPVHRDGVGKFCRAVRAAVSTVYFRVDDARPDNVHTDAFTGNFPCQTKAEGGLASSFRSDMASEGDIASMFEAADKLGTVTAFVANAGIAASQSRVDELTASRITELLAVNVAGPLLACGHAVRRMSTLRGGSGGGIVLVSSVASRLGAAGEYVDYAASNGAIDTLGLGLSREVAGEGIRVNVVRPGIIDTEIHGRNGRPDRATELAHTIPMQRPGHAAEVAASIIWLLSDDASYCTGSILDVAGGR